MYTAGKAPVLAASVSGASQAQPEGSGTVLSGAPGAASSPSGIEQLGSAFSMTILPPAVPV